MAFVGDLMRRGPAGRANPWPALALTALLAALIVPPMAMLLKTSLTNVNPDYSSGGFTLKYFAQIFDSAQLISATFNTVLFSLASTVLALLHGGLIAWLVTRTDLPFKRLTYLTTIGSLGTPYVLYVASWAFLLGRSGPLNDLYRLATGAEGVLFDVYGMTGMIVIDALLAFPFVFLLMTSVFQAGNREMEEAAHMSGASLPRMVFRISFGLARPAVIALAVLMFIRNFESLEIPAVIGLPGGIEVLITVIYGNAVETPPEVGYASAFAILMLVALVLLLRLYSRLSKNAERFATMSGRGFRPQVFHVGKWRKTGAAVLILNCVVVLGLPLLAMIWISLSPYLQPIRPEGLASLSLDNFTALLEGDRFVDVVINTLTVSAAAATIVVGITALGAWMSIRRRPGSALIDPLATIPVVFPGVILGIALQEFALNISLPIYGTLWLVLLAFLIKYMPYGIRYSSSGVFQIGVELEQAASVSGASLPQMLRRIVAPLLRPAMVSGWLFVFLLGTKDLALPLLLGGANSRTVSMSIYAMWQDGSAGGAMALGLVWAAGITLCAGLPYLALVRRSNLQDSNA
jgi:iron(III) transport system permease protein